MRHASEMLTSFNITMTSRIDVRAAVHFFIFPTGWYGYVRKRESIIGAQWGRKIPTQGPTGQVRNEACRVSPLNGGPEGWDFLEPLNGNNRLFFSHTFSDVLYNAYLLVRPLRLFTLYKGQLFVGHHNWIKAIKQLIKQ